MMLNKADSRFAPSQWETALLCNDVSHWLGTNLESALLNIASDYALFSDGTKSLPEPMPTIVLKMSAMLFGVNLNK